MTFVPRSMLLFVLTLSSCRCSEPTPTPDGGSPVTGGGMAGSSCAADQLTCDGRCIDPQTSVTNCGSCGRVCAGAPNASAACVAGRCTTACLERFLDCDGDRENGCEADTQTSLANCGRCGRACAAPAGQTASCSAGQCAACPTGQTACGTSCVDTQTSRLHCGTCGFSCGPASCVAGACVGLGLPTLTAAVPAGVFGARRNDVRLQGTNFRAGVSVRFNGERATVMNVTPTELTVRSPFLGLDAGPVRIEVLNDDGLGVISTSVLSVRGVTTSFAAPTSTALASAAFHVVVLDFDADGRLDLMAPRPDSNVVSGVRNSATGLAVVADYMATSPLFGVRGDFNGDGRMDVAVTSRGEPRVSVLLNSGVGFATTSLTIPIQGAGLAAADFDANATLDLVVGSSVNNGFTVLSGAGDGTFAAQPVVQTLTPSPWPFTGRLGTDTRLTVVSTMVGGGFVAARSLSSVPDVSYGSVRDIAPRGGALADLDDDGTPDLVVCASTSGAALVSFGVSTSRPNTTQVLSQTVSGSKWVAVDDLNGDGAPDIVVAGPGGHLAVYANEGGRFPRETLLATGTHESVSLADLDGDGLLDLVVPQGTSNSILVFHNQSAVAP